MKTPAKPVGEGLTGSSRSSARWGKAMASNALVGNQQVDTLGGVSLEGLRRSRLSCASSL
jgi:hypothetical protein